MDVESLAKGLIEAVEGVVTDKNIEGVSLVFKSMLQAQDLNWEQWIAEDTNEALAIDNIACDCGRLVKVERTRSSVYVDVI